MFKALNAVFMFGGTSNSSITHYCLEDDGEEKKEKKKKINILSLPQLTRVKLLFIFEQSHLSAQFVI